MSQTFTVTATPRQRYVLAVMLLNRNLVFKTREESKRADRAFTALGLNAPAEIFLLYNPGPGPERIGSIAQDTETRNRFEVTQDNADFILSHLDKIEKSQAQRLWTQGLIDQLDERKDAADAETAPPYDHAAELPRWKPSLTPLLENTVLTVAVLRDLHLQHQSFGAYRQAFLDASATPEEGGGQN